ncbi:MAG: exosortase/archaeosortase family protein [Phycisphaerae bacterium]
MSTPIQANGSGSHATSSISAPLGATLAGCSVRWAQAIVLAALIILAYWDTIRGDLIGRWISDGNWSHSWLIPLFSVYLLYGRYDELRAARVEPGWTGTLVLAASLMLFFVAGWVLRIAYLQRVSLVGTILGTTLLMAGWSVLRIAFVPIGLLLLAIPLPAQLYIDLTTPLRELATTIAATVLPMFCPGLMVESQAVVIDYFLPGSPPGQLNVEEACSGMRLMMAFVTLGVVMAYLKNRPGWHRVVLVLSCLPIVVLCNSVRVTITGLLHIHGYLDWARGTPHQLLGISMLFLALGLFAVVGLVLDHLFVEPPEDDAPPSSAVSSGVHRGP